MVDAMIMANIISQPFLSLQLLKVLPWLFAHGEERLIVRVTPALITSGTRLVDLPWNWFLVDGDCDCSHDELIHVMVDELVGLWNSFG